MRRAKLFSASSVSAMMTMATDRLIPNPFTGVSKVKSGRCSPGSPDTTGDRQGTPRPARSNRAEPAAPAAMMRMAMGNLGRNRLDSSRMVRAAAPSSRDSQWMDWLAVWICSNSSSSSPVPAACPMSLGTCMRMMVQQMPLIKPPITGAEMKLSTFPAFSRANSSSHTPV